MWGERQWQGHTVRSGTRFYGNVAQAQQRAVSQALQMTPNFHKVSVGILDEQLCICSDQTEFIPENTARHKKFESLKSNSVLV